MSAEKYIFRESCLIDLLDRSRKEKKKKRRNFYIFINIIRFFDDVAADGSNFEVFSMHHASKNFEVHKGPQEQKKSLDGTHSRAFLIHCRHHGAQSESSSKTGLT